MRVINCEQYSPEWWAARRGIPTASEFSNILTPKTMKPSASQRRYICELITQDQFGFGTEIRRTEAMKHGTETEHQARLWYAMDQNADVQQVGFCLTDDGRFGCSPDGIIGDEGCLEIKCPTSETHLAWLLDGVVPSEHICQVAGELIVTGRKWCHFVSYCPPWPSLIVPVRPGEFTIALSKELDLFHTKLQATREFILNLRDGKHE